MTNITPHLWFDTQAVEAARLYCDTFGDAEIIALSEIRNTPSGDCDIVRFRIFDQPFQSISAGDMFPFTPAVSFTVRCSSVDEVDRYWTSLSEDGTTLMPLDAYPFSERYGWVADRTGLSWQIMLDQPGAARQRIVPSLMFVGDVCGQAEDAAQHYTGIFDDATVEHVTRYTASAAPDREGSVMYGMFTLGGRLFSMMDSAHAHDFAFKGAVSFMVSCANQGEIDRYWQALSAVPEAERCGWLQDRFGVSWQIVPAAMGEMMQHGTREQVDRVTQAFLPMTKFDIATLERAYAGELNEA